MRNQDSSFQDILTKAYEKGENEQGLTVKELLQYLSNKLEGLVNHSEK